MKKEKLKKSLKDKVKNFLILGGAALAFNALSWNVGDYISMDYSLNKINKSFVKNYVIEKTKENYQKDDLFHQIYEFGSYLRVNQEKYQEDDSLRQIYEFENSLKVNREK